MANALIVSRSAMEWKTVLMGVMSLIVTSVMAVCTGWSMEKRLRFLRLHVLLLNQAMALNKSTAMETALLNTREEMIFTPLHEPALCNGRMKCARMENESFKESQPSENAAKENCATTRTEEKIVSLVNLHVLMDNASIMH